MQIYFYFIIAVTGPPLCSEMNPLLLHLSLSILFLYLKAVCIPGRIHLFAAALWVLWHTCNKKERQISNSCSLHSYLLMPPTQTVLLPCKVLAYFSERTLTWSQHINREWARLRQIMTEQIVRLDMTSLPTFGYIFVWWKKRLIRFTTVIQIISLYGPECAEQHITKMNIWSCPILLACQEVRVINVFKQLCLNGTQHNQHLI